MTELKCADDFKWYKAKLDLDAKEDHKHVNEPTKYPCRVHSEYDDDDNGHMSYTHYF